MGDNRFCANLIEKYALGKNRHKQVFANTKTRTLVNLQRIKTCRCNVIQSSSMLANTAGPLVTVGLLDVTLTDTQASVKPTTIAVFSCKVITCVLPVPGLRADQSLTVTQKPLSYCVVHDKACQHQNPLLLHF